jgi:hypothetical protein
MNTTPISTTRLPKGKDAFHIVVFLSFVVFFAQTVTFAQQSSAKRPESRKAGSSVIAGAGHITMWGRTFSSSTATQTFSDIQLVDMGEYQLSSANTSEITTDATTKPIRSGNRLWLFRMKSLEQPHSAMHTTSRNASAQNSLQVGEVYEISRQR